MKVSEAIMIQKEFVANKYHIFKFSNIKLKESMKTLTNAYDSLWEFLEKNYIDILDKYLMSLEK